MASIGSLSSSTSSLVSGGNGLHGYGGLASGLDRDTLIESMTYATRVKIAKKQQKKQSLEWKQTAYRSVTDKLVALSSKYMDYTNPTTNLSSSSLFARTSITAYGKNSSKVSVTSSGTNSADSLTILGVQQMAKNTSVTTAGISNKTLETAKIENNQNVNVLKGQTISIEYGGNTYSVSLNGFNAQNTQGTASDEALMKDLAESLNAALSKIDVKGEKDVKLSEKIAFTSDSTGLTLSNKSDGTVKIKGSGEGIQHAMGMDKEGKEIAANGTISMEAGAFVRRTTFEDRITGGSLNFTYNGKSADIRISAEALAEAKKTSGGDIMKAVGTVLQDGLDKAFGKGRITVDQEELKNGKFSFKTTLPDGTDDDTSILALNYGSSGLVGDDGAFNVKSGENNRLNLNAAIGSGLTGLAGSFDASKLTDENALVINGTKIKISKDSTINDIIDQINRSDAGVNVTYLQNSDKFVITSKTEGAGGEVKWEGDFAKALFGDSAQAKRQEGQDAIIAIQYAGSSEVVELRRGSNNFIQDGLNISIKGEFGYKRDESGTLIMDKDNKPQIEKGEEVTFESKANVEGILGAIKDMVAAYNEVVDLVSGFLTTKPNRDYQPLSDEQKEEMTEEQIEKWEKKAKEGILFGDDLMRNLSSDLRFVAMGSLMSQLETIGISEVSDYTANGKLTIDENKLKNALETDPDKVAKLFSSTDPAQPGLMVNMKKITDSYAKTLGNPKGSLVQRAGSEASAISLTDNEIYKELKDIDSLISQLQTRLKSEQDRYISQFTTLETLIAQMNSQSSYLSSMSGGY